jgi:hypothetical protein
MINDYEARGSVGRWPTDARLNLGDLTRSVGNRNGKNLIPTIFCVGFA